MKSILCMLFILTKCTMCISQTDTAVRKLNVDSLIKIIDLARKEEQRIWRTELDGRDSTFLDSIQNSVGIATKDKVLERTLQNWILSHEFPSVITIPLVKLLVKYYKDSDSTITFLCDNIFLSKYDGENYRSAVTINFGPIYQVIYSEEEYCKMIAKKIIYSDFLRKEIRIETMPFAFIVEKAGYIKQLSRSAKREKNINIKKTKKQILELANYRQSNKLKKKWHKG